jgi:hypothetical protein
MKRIIVLGPLAALLVLGSLLVPSSVPGRSADERLEHGLPIPFIRQKLVDGTMGPGPWAYRGHALAPQEYPTEVSEAALLADIVIVAIGLRLVGGLLSRRRRRSTSNGQLDPGRPITRPRPGLRMPPTGAAMGPRTTGDQASTTDHSGKQIARPEPMSLNRRRSRMRPTSTLKATVRGSSPWRRTPISPGAWPPAARSPSRRERPGVPGRVWRQGRPGGPACYGSCSCSKPAG